MQIDRILEILNTEIKYKEAMLESAYKEIAQLKAEYGELKEEFEKLKGGEGK